jgi:hypothetical protein
VDAAADHAPALLEPLSMELFKSAAGERKFLKLYYAPGACSLAPHIVLREAGYQFDLDKVGYVPALKLDNGEVLTEKMLAGKQYAMGDKYSVADAYLFTVLNWTNVHKIDVAKWPNIKALMERVRNRPRVQETLKAEGLIK